MIGTAPTERAWRWAPPALVGVAVGSAALPNPAAGAVIVALVALAALALSRPILALAAYAAVIVTNAAQVATDFHGLPAVGGTMVPLLILVLLARAAFGLEDLSVMFRVLPFVLGYLALSATALLWVAQAEPSADALIELTKNVLIALMFAGFLTSFARLRMIARTVGIAVSVVAVVSVVQYLTQTFDSTYLGFSVALVRGIAGEEESWRLAGPLGDPNYYGQLLVMALPIAAALALAERGVVRVGGILGTGAILLAILFTFSRGALIGVMVMLTLTALTLRWRWSAVIVVGAVIAIAASIATQGLGERLSAISQAVLAVFESTQFVADPALAQRLSVNGAALQMISDAPLLGVGVGQFPLRYPDFALAYGFDVGAPAEAHNLFLQLTAEGGFVTLAVFLALLALVAAGGMRAVRRLRDARRRDDAMLVLALLLGFAGYLSTAVFLHADYTRYFWLVLSMVVAAAATAPGTRTPDQPRDMLLESSPVPTQYLTIPDVLSVLWRRKWLILLVALLSASAAGLRNMATPREHQGEVDLLFRFGRDYFPISPGEARRNWGENTLVSLDAALFTEMRLLMAQEQFEHTAEAVGTGFIAAGPAQVPLTARILSLVSPEVPDPGGTETAPASADLAQGLSHRFEVRRVPGSAVVTVGARHTVPEVADTLVERHVAGYFDRRSAILDPDAESFFNTRIAAARQEYAALVAARAKALEGGRGSVRPDPRSTPTVSGGASESPSALDAMIAATLDNLTELERERQNWNLSREFRREVMPTAEIIDRRQAASNPVGLDPNVRVVVASVIGFMLASAYALIAAMLLKPKR